MFLVLGLENKELGISCFFKLLIMHGEQFVFVRVMMAKVPK